MPHVELPPLPGIVGLLAGYPRTGEQLSGLADALLRGPSSLTPAERETIGAYVSARNNCEFCASTHSAVALRLQSGTAVAGLPVTGGNPETIDSAGAGGHAAVTAGADAQPAEAGVKMQALLALAEKVRVDGRSVTEADIRRAREAGADDQAIHDTVLTAAMFSMFNRYVDGLATLTPTDPGHYDRHAQMLADHGYRRPPGP
jgi:AhpD family alkylhydroperoxidase